MQGNYSQDRLAERVAVSKAKFAGYIRGILAAYDDRQAFRKDNHLPSIAFCGFGRAGKDMSAEYLCKITALKYPGSNSQMVLPIIADTIGLPPDQAFAERHQNRQFWIDWCHEFRGSDFSLLARMCLSSGDVTVGTRGRVEVDSIHNDGVVDFSLWIDNNRVPPDPTVEYGPEDCDFVILNHGSRRELFARIRKFVRILQAGFFK